MLKVIEGKKDVPEVERAKVDVGLLEHDWGFSGVCGE